MTIELTQKKSLKENIAEFKKELTWNHLKGAICVTIPVMGVVYFWSIWFDQVIHIYNVYFSNPATITDCIISICLVLGAVTPLRFGLSYVTSFGLWLGKILGFYKEDKKTRTIIFDDVSYQLKNMPNEEREKIKELFAKYKKETK